MHMNRTGYQNLMMCNGGLMLRELYIRFSISQLIQQKQLLWQSFWNSGIKL
ncbi:MAG: hypothetical protein HPY85_03665 [Anaerolineae bacterium]|nr:hypothetical protein [Anaerolineae bacterium]